MWYETTDSGGNIVPMDPEYMASFETYEAGSFTQHRNCECGLKKHGTLVEEWPLVRALSLSSGLETTAEDVEGEKVEDLWVIFVFGSELHKHSRGSSLVMPNRF